MIEKLTSRKLLLGGFGVAGQVGILYIVAQLVPDLLTAEMIYLALAGCAGLTGVVASKQAEIDKVVAANGGSK